MRTAGWCLAAALATTACRDAARRTPGELDDGPPDQPAAIISSDHVVTFAAAEGDGEVTLRTAPGAPDRWVLAPYPTTPAQVVPTDRGLELRQADTVLASLASDGSGGLEIVLERPAAGGADAPAAPTVDGPARYRVTGLDSGTLVVLDPRGVALVRAKRDGARATGADGKGVALGRAQVEGNDVVMYGPIDAGRRGRVQGVTDPALGLVLSVTAVPLELRGLLAAYDMARAKPPR